MQMYIKKDFNFINNITNRNMPRVEAILDSPNDFNPRDIRDIVKNGNLTQDQLESLEQRLDVIHMNAFKDGLKLKNEEVDFEKCSSEDVKYEDLREYIDKYGKYAETEKSISEHYGKVRELLDAKEDEKRQFDSFMVRIESLSSNGKIQAIDDFKQEYERIAVTFQKELEGLLDKISEDDQYNSLLENVKSDISFEEKRNAVNIFLENHPFSAYRNDAEAMKKQIEEGEKSERRKADENAWDEVKRIIESPVDPDYKKEKLNEYERSFELHRHEIPQMRGEIDAERMVMPNINAVLGNPNSDVIDFIRLVRQYPQRKRYICDFILRDMCENPARYDRVEMNWLINGKRDVVDNIDAVFTPDEIVNSGAVTWPIMNHIMTHPTDESDRNVGENEIRPETNFESAKNNTDVYFFGVPGSGKSTVMAGLLNIQTYGDLSLNVLTNGGHCGYKYASILKNYLRDNLFPQSTKIRFDVNREDNPFVANDENDNIGDKFIQIIDAELENCRVNENHRLSIIEMPGERTLELAVAPAKDPAMMDDLLGRGTSRLFQNDNNKVFFFVIDPNPQRKYLLPNGAEVSQADALWNLVTFIRDVPTLLSKVHAVHVILSKSDTLQNAKDFNVISERILHDYDGFIRGVVDLCGKERGNVNAQCGRLPYLFTFSLGRVFPGNMNEYKKDDAGKILEVIAANTWSTSSKPSRWESLVEFMNK